ncbi:MAG: hypothetical protein ACTHU0_07395 [Kofleriaceae bacterium]
MPPRCSTVRRAELVATLLLAAAACGAPSATAEHRPATTRPTAAPSPKLSPYLAERWRRGELATEDFTPIVVHAASPIDDAARGELAALGAHFPFLVTVEVTVPPGPAGTVVARRSTAPSTAIVAMVPDHAIAELASRAWVTRLDFAQSYPTGPDLPPTVRARLDPSLRAALRQLGHRRPTTIDASGELAGCLDDARRAALVAAGAQLRTVIPHPQCTYTIITFSIELDRLVALASLDGIVQLEGPGRME